MPRKLQDVQKVPTGLRCCGECGKQWPKEKAPDYCPDCGESLYAVKGYEFLYNDGTKESMIVSFKAFEKTKVTKL
jgi:predicted amidophosphoribosyltransferase